MTEHSAITFFFIIFFDHFFTNVRSKKQKKVKNREKVKEIVACGISTMAEKLLLQHEKELGKKKAEPKLTLP